MMKQPSPSKTLYAALAATLLFSSAPSWAGTINSNTDSFGFTTTSTTLSFTPFDTTLGTLTNVTLKFATGTLTVAGAFPFQDGNCSGTAIVSLSATVASTTANLFTKTLTDSGGCKEASQVVESFSGAAFDVPFDSLVLGPSNISLTLRRSTSFSGFVGGSTRVSGSAYLAYTYDPAPPDSPAVPEPASFAYLSSALAAFALSRTFRKYRRS